MSRMKYSGQTQGRLVFSYDIREGHIDYKKLLPALNKRVIEMDIEAVVEEKELENIMAEALLQLNEELYNSFVEYTLKKKTSIDMQKILDEAIKSVLENE